jgi:excisionase family DNA binding protein
MADLEKERAFVDAAIKPGLAFSIVETARILRRNELWVRELLNSGELRSIRLGRRRMVPRAALIEVLTKGTT